MIAFWCLKVAVEALVVEAPAVEYEVGSCWWVKPIIGKTFQDERMRNMSTKGEPVPD